MCDILEKSNLQSFTGYKVVLHKNGEFFSAMTEQKYNKNWLPKVRSGRDIGYGFRPLTPNVFFFKERMVGRTFILEEAEDAFQIKRGLFYRHSLDKDKSIVVVKATIFGGLYKASYGNGGRDLKGYIGRRIVIDKII